MKALLFIPTYKRYNVAEFCYQKTKDLINAAPDWIELSCLVVGSTDDDIKLAKKYGFYTVQADNEPLGQKKNKGVRFALDQVYKAFKWDYLIECDSDGVILPALFDHYKRYFDLKTEFFGTNRICFFHANSGEILDYNLQNGGVWVTGRVISRHICRHMELGLWHPERESGLGMNMEDRIMDEMSIRVKIIWTEVPLMLDIKTDRNISKFSSLANNYQECRKVIDHKEASEMLGRFGLISVIHSIL